MPKYTYKDIIIDPTSEEAKNCIGKMVYYADNPSICLNSANNDCFRGILDGIKYGVYAPFVIKGDDKTRWVCIIPCEEEPNPGYIQFSNPDEFVDAYISNLDKRIDIGAIHKLDKFGMWLRWKGDYVEVEYISNQGINENTKLMADWQDLFDNYTFLDGTPCGKRAE